jgi:hypothetical protein
VIWASLIFEGSELFYIPVLNPGSCEGKTWYVEFVGDVPNRLVLEAESVCDALFVLNNDPEWGTLVSDLLIWGPGRVRGCWTYLLAETVLGGILVFRG